jgi:predicted PurR-regulated permease PerM
MNRLIGLALLLLAFWLLCDVILLVFAAILVAVALRGAADRVSSATGLGPQAGLGIVSLTLLGSLAAIVWLSGPAMIDQAGQLWDQILVAAARVRDLLQQTNWGSTMLRIISPERLVSGAGAIAGTIPVLVSSTIGAFGSLLIIIVTGIYLAAAPGTYTRGIVVLVPPAHRSRAREVLWELGDTLRGWLFGQIIDMAIVAVLTGIGLLLLGIPLALPLALVAGLLNFVPYVGAIAGAVPALLIAFGQSPTDALWVALLFIGVQMAEGYLIMPQIQKRTIDLPPALAILSQTVLGTLFGAFGLILATPAVAVGLVAVRMIYVEDILGDRDPETRSTDSAKEGGGRQAQCRSEAPLNGSFSGRREG